MKKKGLIIIACCMAALLSGCGRKKSEAPEAAGLVQDGGLTVAIIDGGDSYCRTEGDGLAGAEAYLAKSFAAAQGLELKFREASSKEELLDMIDGREADMALGRLTSGFEGAESYAFSRVYGKGGLYLVALAGNYANTLSSFNGQNVGISPEIAVEVSAQIPLIDTVTSTVFSDTESAAEQLKKGSCSALICTEREAFSLLEDEGLQVQELLNGPKESYSAVFPAGSDAMVSDFGSVVSEYQEALASGELVFGRQAEAAAVSRESQGGE